MSNVSKAPVTLTLSSNKLLLKSIFVNFLLKGL
jgi:hypothetical protein